MSLELLIPTGAILTLNAFLIGVLVILVRSLRGMTETNIDLNGELRAGVKERQVQQGRIEELQSQVSTLRDEQAEDRKTITALTSELGTIKTSMVDMTNILKVSQSQVVDLQTRERLLTLEITASKKRIDELEADNKKKDDELLKLVSRVNDLELELKRTNDAREVLEREKTELMQQLLSRASEPGETKQPEPEASETTEEKPKEE
jgi:chromosome segregation ATPase